MRTQKAISHQSMSGAEAQASFPVPAQLLLADAVHRVSYSITAAGDTPQHGEIVADLRVRSRWWVKHRVETIPELGVLDKFPEGAPRTVAEWEGIFEAARPPTGWEQVLGGRGLDCDKLARKPEQASAIFAATRVMSSVERNAVINVDGQTRFITRIWFNGEVVRETEIERSGRKGTIEKTQSKPFVIRKGSNTMLIECVWGVVSSKNTSKNDYGIPVEFVGVKSGEPFHDLVIDISGKM